MWARDERTATKNVRCWCLIFLEKSQKKRQRSSPPLSLLRPRVKSSRRDFKKSRGRPWKDQSFKNKTEKKEWYQVKNKQKNKN